MTRPLWILILTFAAVAAATLDGAAQPPGGSQLKPDDNNCAKCHGEEDLWEKDRLRLFINPESLAKDVHFRKGVNCHDCHGGDPATFEVPEAHAREVDKSKTGVAPFRFPLSDIWNSCGNCHKAQRLDLVKGVHAKAGARDALGRKLPLGCAECHGEKAHGMLPVRDGGSPVFLDHQVERCGRCHAEDLATYKLTIHGDGLYKSGLLVTAACADCHGAHGIYYAADTRSTLNPARVAQTCGKCHRGIEERLTKSVHGGEKGPGTLAATVAAGGKTRRTPSCTSCHQGHHLLRPESAQFQHQLTNLCGNCHPDLSSRYGMSLHGELTRLGYQPAAKCSDCHGAHEILAVDDPQSPVAAGANRVDTCRKCHPGAGANFAMFDPHATYKDPKAYPWLASVYRGIETVLWLCLAVFAVHALLWFVRALVQTLQHGRHKTLVTEKSALVRSEPGLRASQVLLIVAFLGLTLTGVPLKYSGHAWAAALARGMGGFESTSVWHRFFAVLAIGSCVAQTVWGVKHVTAARRAGRDWRTALFGPDSTLPNARDARDLWGMLRWFVGLGPKPVFERWTYWEKLDYWGVCAAAVVIGASGLALWYPVLVSLVLPGTALNLAKVVHSEVAIFAAGLVFVMHFFHTHFRPEKFPLDVSALTGMVSEEHLREYRPEYVARLEQSGELARLRRPAPSRRRLRAALLSGFLVFSLGICLLAMILLATLGE